MTLGEVQYILRGRRPSEFFTGASVRLYVAEEASRNCLRIAEGGFWASREAARTYAKLKSLEKRVATAPTFWNVADCANGTLESGVVLKSGAPLWRLHPKHSHCIALMAEIGGDLIVLDFCSRADLAEAEARLAERH